MSRMATTSARRNRAVWDRPATDTHLLLWLQPIPVFLGNPLDPLRKSIVASAPSRPPFPQRHRAADARVPSPRMITHGSYPQRACPTTVDARVLSRMISCSASLGVEADACGYTSRMISRSALLGVEADACGYASRMISRSALLGVEADACGYASRMISRSALLGVEADACGYASRMISRSALLGVEADACANPQMISRTPFRAAEGALANLILILSPFRHSGLRAGIHPFNSSLSSSRDDRPVALGVGAPNRAPTPLSPYTKGPA